MGVIFQSSPQTMTPDQQRQALKDKLSSQILGNLPSASASLGQMGDVDSLWLAQQKYDQQQARTHVPPVDPPPQPRGYYGGGLTPDTAGGGVGALLNGLAQWRQRQPAQQYPDAPGGAQPSLMTSLMNRFGSNGGLY